MSTHSTPTTTLPELPELWTPKQLAEYRHTTVAVLCQERYLGKGPKFIKDGKRIRYSTKHIREYLDARTETPGRSATAAAARD